MPCAFPWKAYIDLPSEPETWVIRPLLPAGGSAVIYADAKVGKSFAAIQMAQSIATGQPWLGFEIMQAGPVLYIQLDTPRSLWIDRLKMLMSTGIRPSPDVIFADRETLDAFPFNILYPEHFKRLRETVDHFRPTTVIIDTLREIHGQNENDSTEMRNVVAAITAATTPAAIVLITHARKLGENGPDLINDLRGSNYVVGRMDAILNFTPRSLKFTGRATETGTVRLARTHNFLWTLSRPEVDEALVKVLAEPNLDSDRAKAKRLAEATGLSISAARHVVQRQT